MLSSLALGLVSALPATSPRSGWPRWRLTVLLCTLALVVSAFVRTSPIDVPLWTGRAALFLAAAHVAGGFTRYAAALETGTALGTEIWMLGFSNPRVASAFYALLIPLAAMSTSPAVEPDRRLRWTSWIVGGLWAVASGLQARALWFSYAIAIPALLFVLPSRPARRLAVVLVATAAIGVAIQWALPLPGSELGGAGLRSRELTSLTARDVLWKLAIDATLQAPLLGIGPGEFARLGSFAGAHPHNWILQFACEWGLPALVAVLFGARRPCETHSLNTRDRDRQRPAAACRHPFDVRRPRVRARRWHAGDADFPAAFAVAFGLTLGALQFDAVDAASADGYARRSGGTARVGPATSVLAMHRAIVTYREQPGETVEFRQRFPESGWRRGSGSGLKLVGTSSTSRR